MASDDTTRIKPAPTQVRPLSPPAPMALPISDMAEPRFRSRIFTTNAAGAPVLEPMAYCRYLWYAVEFGHQHHVRAAVWSRMLV
jgi:hypothetical protein